MTATMHRLPRNGDGYSEALDYNRLPEPWHEWAKVASNFIWTLDNQWDREDLMHIFETESQEKYSPMPTEVGFS